MAKNLGRKNVEDTVSVKPVPEIGGLKFKNAFKWEDDRWKQIASEELFDVKIGELWHEEKRLMLVCEYNNFTVYVVCNDTDYEAVKKKYPKSCCVHINQLFRMWNGVINEDYILNTVPKVMMALTTFEGAKIIDVLPA